MNTLKQEVYYESLSEAILAVEMHINHLKQIEENTEIDHAYIQKDISKTRLNFELSLATLCILLRKMSENSIIKFDDDIRKDINSVIHSSRFDYEDAIYAYSRNGKEKLDLDAILSLAKKYAK